MANPNIIFIFSTLLLASFFLLAHSQDVTTFTFDSFPQNPTNLIYQGDAHVPQNSKTLRLTKTDSSGMFPETSSTGRVLYSPPVHFWDSTRESTFETTISFSISPGVTGSADGLAFFIAPVDTTIPSGSPAENLGIFNKSGTADSIFAVEFDTYVNPGLDPDYPHIGIDINSVVSRNTIPFESGNGDRVTARIDYDSNRREIYVKATSGSSTAELSYMGGPTLGPHQAPAQCKSSPTTYICIPPHYEILDSPLLSYVLDLKTVLPQWVRVGISSATGPAFEKLGIHDIHSWYFTSTLVWHNAVGEGKKEKTYIRKYACSE